MKNCYLMHLYSSSKAQRCLQEPSLILRQGWAPPLGSHCPGFPYTALTTLGYH